MKRTRQSAFALLLTLCVALVLLPALTPTASAADNVTYLDANGATQTAASATSVTASDTAWGSVDSMTWYVVDSTLENTNRITVTGDVHLILKDGAKLTASEGITVTGSNSLTIYAQSTDAATMGKLSATNRGNGAGIGGIGGAGGAGGTITVNGGEVTANGAPCCAGIGGSDSGVGGTITVNGGAVTAHGGSGGAGIGGGFIGASGAISITGGTVTANGNVGGGSNTGGAGIGGGENGDNSGNSISITGGTVTATVLNGKGAAIGNGGGNDGTDCTVTIGAGATVMAGDNADGATDVTTAFASSHTQKYAKITFAPVAPSYTVTAADTVTTEKKYKYGDAFTIAVTVSGGDFEGGEFTLTYDKDMFQLTAETVAPDKNDDKAINAATGNKFNEDSDGKYAFSLNNRIKFTNEDAIVHLNFKVAGKTTEEKAFDFAFDTTNPPKICYDTDKDSVEATAAKGSVTLEPILYAVTLTPSPSEGFALTGDNGVEGADNAKAIDGQPYVVTIGGYDADNYSYAVALKVGGTDVASPPQPDSNGIITLAANSFGGDIVMTVTRTLANFTVTVSESDYVTGWALILVAKDSSRTDSPVYCYDTHPMYYVNAYNAYAYLVEATTENPAPTVNDAKTKVTLGTAAAGTITNGATDTTKYDVNGTGKTDYSDALLTYRCYIKAYQTPGTAMETYLRADVNGDKKADTTDVSAIDANRTTQETPSA